jgi:nucleoside 2-deoxyribosyltransferase
MKPVPIKIYLAGPEVFLKDARIIFRQKCEICLQFGFEGVPPVDDGIDITRMDPMDAGLAISKANESLLSHCDMLIANATPFRGPSMDVGTAFEMGFMRAQGKPVLAYTNCDRPFVDRVLEGSRRPTSQPHEEIPRDRDGMIVENYGFAENLMIEGAVLNSFGEIVRHRAANHQLFTDLAGFTVCVKMATGILGRHSAKGARSA